MEEKTVNDSISDLLEGRRKFEIENEDGSVDSYFIGSPSGDDIKQADWQHAKTYNQALKEGVFTQSEMMDILKHRGVIGPDYEVVGESIRAELAEKIILMERETDREKRIDFAVDVSKLRDDLFQWNQRLNGPLASTCENIANDARIEYLTSCVVQKIDGSKVWDSYEKFKDERDFALQTKSRLEVMLWMEGLGSDALTNTPENTVLREAIEQVTTEAEAAIEEAEAKEEVVEPPDTEKKPIVRKRRTRRKKKAS
jgi:hypothetical protein